MAKVMTRVRLKRVGNERSRCRREAGRTNLTLESSLLVCAHINSVHHVLRCLSSRCPWPIVHKLTLQLLLLSGMLLHHLLLELLLLQQVGSVLALTLFAALALHLLFALGCSLSGRILHLGLLLLD